MSDPDKSGAPETAPADLPAPASPPAEAVPSSSAPSAASAPATFGTFGATRGSGLARGKRPAAHVASAGAPAASAGYKPSSVEVITPQSEYKNPFTGETSVTSPRANEPAPPAVPQPSAAAEKEEAATAPLHSPIPESSAGLDAAARSSAEPSGPVDDPAKPGLNILPPENPRRAAVRWESTPPAASPPSAPAEPRTEERRTFQPARERRENRPFEPRPPREGRDPREGREPREAREPREPRRDEHRHDSRSHQPQPERTPQPEPEKKSAGLLGWFKGLFGGGKTETPADKPYAESPRHGDDFRPGGHRGGRGRGGQGGYRGENRGPRDPQAQSREGDPQGGHGEPRDGDQGGGHRRRRRRGGRGRYRGEGGDRGPRPEGQQGGGAI